MTPSPFPSLGLGTAARAKHASLLAAIALASMTASGLRAQDTTAALHFKGITLSPVGFAAAEGVYRSHLLQADIGSSYSAIPFDGTSQANLSEVRFSGRQSRIGFLADANPGGNHVQGFWEADFLGVGIASNSNESNSYVLRTRQFFGEVTTPDKLTFAAGQMWSLLTTNKVGALPRSEAIPLTIEAQYAVGFNWARQAAFRVVQTEGSATFAAALEEPQTTFSARNAPANILIGTTGGSLLNSTVNYSADVAPDLIAKVAWDPKGWGHWELKGIGRVFRDRFVDPTGAAGGSTNNITFAGGAGFGVYYPVMADGRDVVDLGLSGMYGKGIGRYGTTQLSDATVASDNSLEGIKAAQSLLTIEAHPSTQLDVYAYGGVEYADRTAFINSAGKGVGYGSPLNVNSGCETEAVPTGQYAPATGTCNADIRSYYQGNLGFWYRFYRGSMGTVQYGMQASYTKRNAWSGVGGEPSGNAFMLFSSFRYVLP
jgi:hypothetical protein